MESRILIAPAGNEVDVVLVGAIDAFMIKIVRVKTRVVCVWVFAGWVCGGGVGAG